MSEQWFVMHSHPHKEDLLWEQILTRNIRGYYPRYRVKPVNPRSKKIRPYFPGYLFVFTDLQQLGETVLQHMPYGTGLVKFGGEPAVVPEGLIAGIQRHLEQLARDKAGGVEEIKNGDSVKVTSGPFNGYEGLFDIHISGTKRVRILLSLLDHRLLPVELEEEAVAPNHRH